MIRTKIVAAIVTAILFASTSTGLMTSAYGAETAGSDQYNEAKKFRIDFSPPGPPSVLKQLTHIDHHLGKISERLNAVLYPPGPPILKALVKQLGVIEGKLALADKHLTRVACQEPPGPPNEPAIITELNGIISNANSIAGIANKALGQSPPGPPQDPAVITELNGIISNAHSIADIASNVDKNGGTGCPPGPPN